MNIIAGWIMPEMNWARKLACVQGLVVLGRRSRATSFWRPKTFTSEWPVYISSMCPLSRPVVAHCRTNCGCARLPIRVATNTEIGTVTSAMTASSGEMTIIMTSTPTMVRSDVRIWLSVCCNVCCRLSMSLVTRLSISPCGWRSK